MIKNLVRSAVAALLGVVPLSVAHASLITWAYSGSVLTESGSIFTVGQTVTGTLTFDNSISGTANGPGTQATYLGALRSFTIDGQSQLTLLSTDPAVDKNEIIIRDGLFGGGVYTDQFSAILEDTSVQSFQFYLQQRGASDPTCINSVALPSAPYSPLSCFDGASPALDALVAFNRVIDPNVRFSFELELGSLTALPEPGTLALIGLGLAGLGLSRRRKA